LYLGANLKILNEKVHSSSGNGYALDFGIYFPFLKYFSLGVSYLNFGDFRLKVDGEKVKLDVPEGLRVGVGYKRENLFFDFEWEDGEYEDILRFGGEVCFKEIYFVRAGYESLSEGLSFGFGIKYKLFKREWYGGSGIRSEKEGKVLLINYSFSPFSELDESIHRFDIGLKF